MKIVLDTNVLVSGLINPYGASAKIVHLTAGGTIRLCYDPRILAEYEEVLARPKFALQPEETATLIAQIRSEGEGVVSAPWPTDLPDPEDAMFLEVAKAGGAYFLVTGNLRHFPASLRRGVKVLPPAEFVKNLAHASRE